MKKNYNQVQSDNIATQSENQVQPATVQPAASSAPEVGNADQNPATPGEEIGFKNPKYLQTSDHTLNGIIAAAGWDDPECRRVANLWERRAASINDALNKQEGRGVETPEPAPAHHVELEDVIAKAAALLEIQASLILVNSDCDQGVVRVTDPLPLRGSAALGLHILACDIADELKTSFYAEN